MRLFGRRAWRLTLVCVVAIVAVQPTVGQEAAPNQASVKDRAPAKVAAIINQAGCGNCHVIPGINAADGTIGPDLSQLAKVAGSRRENYTAKQYIRESILDPDAFIAPGDYEAGVMLGGFEDALNKPELDALIDFLASLGVRDAKSAPQSAADSLDVTRPPESSLEPFAPLSTQALDAQVALGKYLFFDRRLSANAGLSCASCHQPERSFTDGQSLSRGFADAKLFRNTPSLWNVAHARAVYWDGRMSGTDLPSVVRDHLTESFFMAADGRLHIERLKQVPQYVELFQTSFGGEVTFGNILKAVSAYVGSLNTPSTRFDRYQAGDTHALSADEKAGWTLFRGKADCARCHVPPLFTDHGFHDLGLRTDPKLFADPEHHIAFRRFFRGLGVSEYRQLREDVGRYVVSMKESDRHRFRTPGLRQVADSAPYMHDGRIATLQEVVEFYDRGGGPQQHSELRRLVLSDQEKGQLVAFLQCLSATLPKIEAPELPAYVLLPLGNRGFQWPASNAAQETPDKRNARPITPLPAPPHPRDNRATPEKVALGRLLFFDPRFSADGAASCNTCHPAHTGYTARTAISMGGTGTSHWRNSSTLYNVAFFEKFNWDGARTSIEDQNDGAWSGAVAGNVDPELAEERLAQSPEYREQFRAVFGEPEPTWANALRAVAAFQRTIVSKDVPFDDYLRGNEGAITDQAKRGFTIFTGKANCVACHDGPLLSDDRFHSLGVPASPDFLNSPLKQITFRFEQASNGVPREIYESVRDDLGLYYVTKRDQDAGKFRTPSLRELSHTAPYMHNGIFKSLLEVVEFYSRGGGDHPNKSPLLRPLELSEGERQDLVAFLESLSGDPQVDRPPALPSYAPLPATLEDH